MPPAYQGWLIPGDSRQLVPVPLADQSPHLCCELSYSSHCPRPNHQGGDQGAGDTDIPEPSPSALSSPMSAHRHGNTYKAPSPSPSLSASFTVNTSTEMTCTDSHLDISSVGTITSALLMHTCAYLLERMDMIYTLLRCYPNFLLFKIPTTQS